MVPSLLDTLSTPLLLKSFASSLLAIPPTDSDSPSATPTPTDLASPAPGPSPPPVHPLAVLLFLLDGLVFLRSAGPLGDRIRRERLSTTGLGIGIDGGDEADVEDGPTKGTPSRRASVCVDKARTAADSDSESWEDWVAYISEMVRPPFLSSSPSLFLFEASARLGPRPRGSRVATESSTIRIPGAMPPSLRISDPLREGNSRKAESRVSTWQRSLNVRVREGGREEGREFHPTPMGRGRGRLGRRLVLGTSGRELGRKGTS